MARFGLKLGVGEVSLIPAAQALWRDGRYDFLELYIPLDAAAADADNWDWFDGELVLHAPHATSGFNFSRPEMEKENFRCLEVIDRLRAALSADTVVFHPGLNGDPVETVRQVAWLGKEYPRLHAVMVMENKPGLGMRGEQCLGASPAAMRGILAATECGFCLDVRHATAYAAWAGLHWRGVIVDFLRLNPRLWHAADGNLSDPVDSHHHIGDGDMPWREIAAWWKKGTMVTVECVKNTKAELADFMVDVERLRNLADGKE